MREPMLKAAILGEADVEPSSHDPEITFAKVLQAGVGDMFELSEPIDYEPDPSRSIATRAKAEGREPLDLAYDILAQGDGDAVLIWLATNYLDGDLRLTEELLQDPRYLVGLGDAGAHVRVICDASYPTFTLSHWNRDRSRGPRLPVELLVRKMTHDGARLYGLDDRGMLAPGMRADINVINLEELQLSAPRLVADLPADAKRYLQKSTGYVLTMVAGVVTRRDDIDTAERPGRLVRNRHGRGGRIAARDGVLQSQL